MTTRTHAIGLRRFYQIIFLIAFKLVSYFISINLCTSSFFFVHSRRLLSSARPAFKYNLGLIINDRILKHPCYISIWHLDYSNRDPWPLFFHLTDISMHLQLDLYPFTITDMPILFLNKIQCIFRSHSIFYEIISHCRENYISNSQY